MDRNNPKNIFELSPWSIRRSALVLSGQRTDLKFHNKRRLWKDYSDFRFFYINNKMISLRNAIQRFVPPFFTCRQHLFHDA